MASSMKRIPGIRYTANGIRVPIAAEKAALAASAPE
jgi:hypothetical protein